MQTRRGRAVILKAHHVVPRFAVRLRIESVFFFRGDQADGLGMRRELVHPRKPLAQFRDLFG